MSFEAPDMDMVYISNLPRGVNERDVEEFFGSIGILKKDKKTRKPMILLYRDNNSGAYKGDGTVSYEDAFAARSAVDWFHGKEWNGSVLHVSFAKMQEDNYDGGRFGGRGNFRATGPGYARDINDLDNGTAGGFAQGGGGYGRGGAAHGQGHPTGYGNRGSYGGVGHDGGYEQGIGSVGGPNVNMYNDSEGAHYQEQSSATGYCSSEGVQYQQQQFGQPDYDGCSYATQPVVDYGNQAYGYPPTQPRDVGYGGPSGVPNCSGQQPGSLDGSRLHAGQCGPGVGGSFRQDGGGGGGRAPPAFREMREGGGGGRGPPAPKEVREGDWACSCGNVNFSFRGKCNRCGSAKPSGSGGRGGGGGRGFGGRGMGGRGRGRVVAAPQGPLGLFAPDDWACSSCGNMNWARRPKCNVCGTAKPGTTDTNRDGACGGFKELDEQELEEARRRRKQYEDDDNEIYDEFGRLKKKHRSGSMGDRRAREEAALARLYGGQPAL